MIGTCIMNIREWGEPKKYLRESYYHRIVCTAATFLATFMWRKPLNSAALVTTTHRKPKKVSDRIDTQVRAQMINKCRIKMVQRDLYNVRDPPWGGGSKKKKENILAIKIILVIGLIDLYENLSPRTVNAFSSMFLVLVWSSSKSVLAVVKFIRA